MFKSIFSWSLAPKTIKLEDHTIQIWACELSSSPSAIEFYKSLLTPEEFARFNRFHFEKHKIKFAIAHGMLHCVLSLYLMMDPKSIQFAYNSHGKPYLVSDQNPLNLQFNLSHSGDIALLAVTKKNEIGIDVEEIKTRHVELLSLAKTIMSVYEFDQFSALDEVDQENAFFNVWTQKEAFIKALGKGLSFPLKKFSVSLTYPAHLVNLENDDKENWTLRDLEMPPGYKAAIVLKGKIQHVSCWIFEHSKFVG